MPLYTLILDFHGGTYVSQVIASTPHEAFFKGASSLNVKKIKGLGPKGQKVLADELKQDVPLPLEGIENVWCHPALVGGKLALFNLVQTDQQRPVKSKIEKKFPAKTLSRKEEKVRGKK